MANFFFGIFDSNSLLVRCIAFLNNIIFIKGGLEIIE